MRLAVDAARVSVRYNTGVNYYTVRPKVSVEAVNRRVGKVGMRGSEDG